MTIAQIKSSLSLETVLQHYALRPDRNARLRCPWHPDKTPSLQVYPKTNSWTCFSSNCAAGSGDQIDFIMKYEKISKHEAILKAREMVGLNGTGQLKRPIENKNGTDLSRIAVLSKYYQSCIDQIGKNEKAQAYAAGRNLDWRGQGIGYAAYGTGKSWNQLLKTQVEELGLNKIKNCLIFAMRNADGKVIDIYGRSIAKTAKAKHFYLKGQQQGLYPSYPQPGCTTLILCESIIDAASLAPYLAQEEKYCVLALYGTNGFTDEHEQVIRSLEHLQEIILFFDGDQAGHKAAAKYADQLRALRPGLQISSITTPEGEDPNSLLQSHEGGIIGHLIEQRQVLKTQAKPKASAGIPHTGRLDTKNPEMLHYTRTGLDIHVIGGGKITGLDRLRVTLKI